MTKIMALEEGPTPEDENEIGSDTFVCTSSSKVEVTYQVTLESQWQ
jgi:hypothetical protein